MSAVSSDRQEAALTLRVIKALTGNSCVYTGNATETSDCLPGPASDSFLFTYDVITRAYSKISRYGLIYIMRFNFYLLYFNRPNYKFEA